MTLKDIKTLISQGLSWGYNDFLQLQDEIVILAAEGNESAIKLENLFDVIINESSFEHMRPKITSLINKMTEGNNHMSTEALIKGALKVVVQFTGYATLSGKVPASVYDNFMNQYQFMFKLSYQEGNDEAKRVLSLMKGITQDYTNIIVDKHDPVYGKDDYFTYFEKNEVKVGTKRGRPCKK